MTLGEISLKLAYATIPLFWPVWLFTLAAALYIGFSSSDNWRSREPFTMLNAGSYAIAGFVLPYVAFLLWGVDFAYYDNDVLLEYTVSGKLSPLGIWPYQGRFFPLFAQEFNALALIAPTPVCYHAFAALQLVAFCWLLNVALSDIPVAWRVGAVAALIMSNSVGLVFADLIYTERNVVLWLAVLIVALRRFDQSPSRLNVVAALVAAQVALYYQELVLLLVATVALTRLAVAWRREGPVRWRWLTTRPLEVGLLVCCAVFVTQFAVSMLSVDPVAYALERARVGPVHLALQYARTDPLLLVLVAGLALRAGQVRRLADLDPVWDSLALGALVYFIALVLTGLPGTRYAGPVDTIALLFAVRQAAAWSRTMPLGRWAIGTLAVVLALAVTIFGAVRLLEYKSVVRGTVKLVQFVEQYSASHPGELRLYFPNTAGWRMMNVASYMRYRDQRVFERVRFLGPHEFPGGQCVSYLSYRCERALAPEPGDLVVQLPDDPERVEMPRAELQFQYELLPGGLPAAVSRLVYPAAPLYDGREMPKGWLTATAAVVR